MNNKITLWVRIGATAAVMLVVGWIMTDNLVQPLKDIGTLISGISILALIVTVLMLIWRVAHR